MDHADEFAAFVAGIRYSRVALPWGEARVWDEGRGRPVVLLHGIAGGRRVFFRLVPVLSAGARVIVAPLRGEDAPCPRMRREQLLDDVAALLDALDLEDVALLGFSFGAHLALAYAGRGDARVSEVAAAGGFARYRLGLGDRTALALSRLVPARWASRYFVHRALRGQESRLLAGEAPGLEVLVADWMSKTPFASLRARASVTSCPGVEAAVRGARTPIVLGHGDRDPVVPVSASRRLAELRSDARLAIWPGVGHLAPLTRPALVAALVTGGA